MRTGDPNKGPREWADGRGPKLDGRGPKLEGRGPKLEGSGLTDGKGVGPEREGSGMQDGCQTSMREVEAGSGGGPFTISLGPRGLAAWGACSCTRTSFRYGLVGWHNVGVVLSKEGRMEGKRDEHGDQVCRSVHCQPSSRDHGRSTGSSPFKINKSLHAKAPGSLPPLAPRN